MKDKKKLTWGLALVLPVLTLAFLLKSQLFKVNKIFVYAESEVIKKEVEASLQNLLGKSLFDIDLSAVSLQLVKDKLAIQSGVVSRQLPSALFIRIVERKGLAQVFTDKGLAQIDVEGVLFKQGTSGLPLFWPLPNDRAAQLSVLSWFESERAPDVNGLSWDHDLGLILETKSRTKIIMGKTNYAANWKKAKESLQYLKSKGLQSRRIDATYNARAVISL